MPLYDWNLRWRGRRSKNPALCGADGFIGTPTACDDNQMETVACENSAFCDDQYALAYPDGVQHHWWHQARNRIVASAVRGFGDARAPVLDVGCGRGIAVQYLRQCGFDCTGVEPAATEPLPGLQSAVRLGLKAEELDERFKFRTLLLLDVIEHMADPVNFLQVLAEAFPNVRNVIVTVPARQELWSNY